MRKPTLAADAAVQRPLELVPERAIQRTRAPCAIVDIGSNSVRLVVYDQMGRAPFPRFNEKSLCRLGDGLAETGALAADGFRRTVEATRRFRAIAEAMGVVRIDALATEATRRASNGDRLAAAIAKEAGLERLAPERVVFSAFGVREGWLYAQLPAAERYRDPLVEGAQAFGLPQARVPEFAPALVRWTDHLVTGEAPADRRLRLAACALSDIGWRDHRDVQALECFHRLLQFPFIGVDHAERVFIATAIHARYSGSLDDPRLSPAIDLLPRRARRRAQILGRALLLGYRLSGSVPEILDNARLRIDGNRVRVEVGKKARVPDSEVVADRLKLLASALGIRRTEVVEANSQRAVT